MYRISILVTAIMLLAPACHKKPTVIEQQQRERERIKEVLRDVDTDLGDFPEVKDTGDDGDDLLNDDGFPESSPEDSAPTDNPGRLDVPESYIPQDDIYAPVYVDVVGC